VTPKGQSRNRYSAAVGQIPRFTEHISSFTNVSVVEKIAKKIL